MEASLTTNAQTGRWPYWPAGLCVLGYALTLRIFFPGVMTYDARFVYDDVLRSFQGDWQSPVMTSLWGLIDPISPGSGSLFLLVATLYWLAFGILAVAMARRSFWPGLGLALLALSPPAFVFVGVIWRDILFGALWLLVAALGFATRGRTAQLVALGLLALGVLLRPNAIVAAPVLIVYVLWPARFSVKRAAIVAIPSILVLYGVWQGVYYGVLGAVRQHPEQSIMVYDLGGITHFTQQNQFPVSWSADETALLIGSCYQPTEWNVYWTYGPCRFVMERLDRDKIFGSDGLTDAWWHAVIGHPFAYLHHRAGYMWNFLAGDENVTVWLHDLDDPSKFMFEDRADFTALRRVHDALKPTLLFRPVLWLLACAVLCAVAWPRRDTRAGAFILGACGSAALYVASFFFFGVSSDFRYAYWAVLASLSGAVALMLRRYSEDSALDRNVRACPGGKPSIRPAREKPQLS